MNYLFVDSCEGTRVLLSLNGADYYDCNITGAGAQTLMPMIDGLLKKAGGKLSDLQAIGACIGPGSFTGLRIGLATVKSLCHALKIKCFGVNNLRLNSYNNKSDKVVSVADAGSNVCYIAAFDGERQTLDTKCVTLSDAKAYIAEHGEYSVSTDTKLAEKIAGVSGVSARELKLAAERYISNLVEPKDLTPLYVRKAQPEREEGDL